VSDIKPWPRKQHKVLADCRIFSVNEGLAVSPLTSKEHSFYFLETADWVNIVPMTDAGEIVCIRQYRHGSESITIEIPGGMVDMGEQPGIAAARECLEETGYEVSEIESLGVLNPNPAIQSNRLFTYVGRGAELVREIQNTQTEQTEVVLLSVEQAKEMLVAGEIDHALVAATLWRLFFHMQEQSLST